MKLLGLVSVVGAVALSAPIALAQSPATPDKMAPDSTAKMTPAMEHLGIPLATDEKGMLERLHHANQTEIQLAKMAEEKTQNAAIKQYAQMIVRDHTNADARILSYADAQTIRLEDPQPVNDTEKAMMNLQKSTTAALESMTGQAFDEAFLTTMVHQHDVAIATVLAAQQQFAKSSVVSILNAILPSLKQHREQAYKLLGNAVPKLSVG